MESGSGVIFFILFMIIIIVAGVFYMIISIVKHTPLKVLRFVEIVGYFILTVSIVWTAIIFNYAQDMSNSIEKEAINNKLNMIISIEEDKLKNPDDRLESFDQDFNYLRSREESTVYAENQTILIRNINYVLLSLAPILIATGRLSEIVSRKKEKNSIMRQKREKTKQ